MTHGASLLVCLRDDDDRIPFPAYWDLPGGGAEPGETPIQCALRELHEEFGLCLSSDRLVGPVFAPLAGATRESWLFCGKITAAEIAGVRFGDEGQEWRMMPVTEFINHPRAVPHFRDRVRLVLAETMPGI